MDNESTIVSVRDELLEMRKTASNMLATLKRLDRLQETVDKLGGNPYHIRCTVKKKVLAEELADTGFAKALKDATKNNDPNSRELGYAAVCEALVKGMEDLARKKLKLGMRARLGEGSEGEAANVASLTVRMQEAMEGLRRKLKIALDGLLESRKKALEAVAEIDGRIMKMWPNGSVDLRERALHHGTADVLSVLCANDAVFRRGEQKQKVVKV